MAFSQYLNFKQPFLPPFQPRTCCGWILSHEFFQKKKKESFKLKSAKVNENFGLFYSIALHYIYTVILYRTAGAIASNFMPAPFAIFSLFQGQPFILFKVEKILKVSLDLITFTFSENSNYGRESLLEV